MGPNSSDEEYSQWLQRFAQNKERERRTFHPAAIEPETSPIPQWPTGESRIQVKEAAHLLEAGCPLPPIAKPHDIDLRGDLIKSDRYLEIVKRILSNAREGRAPLIHPTLGITVTNPDDPDKDWFIGQEAFEHIRNELLNQRYPVTKKPRCGRTRKPFWAEARSVAMAWLEDEGCPDPGDGNQARLEHHVADWLSERDHDSSEATIRRHVANWIAERRDELERNQ
jgi:hypothetical protein